MPFKNSFKRIVRETSQSHELRKPYLEKIQELRDGRAVVSFFVSFNSAIPLSQPDADMIEGVLCNIDTSQGLTLILDAPGGDGLAAERIIQICKSYSKKDFEAIVPARAKSAATMVCLGSDRILMSPTSELGPIDPQVPVKLDDDGPKWMAAHYVAKVYDDLFQKATSATGRIEPYLQQLNKFNAVFIEHLRAATKLSEDIAVNSLQKGMLVGKSEAEIKDAIKPFTDPELTMSHGRGINYDKARQCGLNIELIDLDSELWQVVWGLYERSKYVVNSGVNKMIETVEGGYHA